MYKHSTFHLLVSSALQTVSFNKLAEEKKKRQELLHANVLASSIYDALANKNLARKSIAPYCRNANGMFCATSAGKIKQSTTAPVGVTAAQHKSKKCQNVKRKQDTIFKVLSGTSANASQNIFTLLSLKLEPAALFWSFSPLSGKKQTRQQDALICLPGPTGSPVVQRGRGLVAVARVRSRPAQTGQWLRQLARQRRQPTVWMWQRWRVAVASAKTSVRCT